MKFQWPVVFNEKTLPTPTVEKAVDNLGRGSGLRFFNQNLNILNSLIGSLGFSFSSSASWQKLSNMNALYDWYHRNPVLYTIVDIKARADSNRRYYVYNKSSGKAEPFDSKKSIPKKAYKILNRPNCFQSRWEYLKLKKINEEVSGNSLTYLNASLGFKPTIENMKSMWQVWPQWMQYKLTGKYFEADEISDIIKSWKFECGTYKKDFRPEEIMLRNHPNTRVEDGLIFGRSTIYAMTRPLTNIDGAYESRNVIINNRGMDLFFSSDKGDASGRVAMQPDETKDFQEEMKEYGLLEGQKQFMMSRLPLKVTPINRDVRRLGLFDEIAVDTMLCAIAWGVPEILIKLYMSGATFENQEIAVRRLYQDTLIPEAEDDDMSLNYYWGLEDTEWEIRSSFDHLPILQKSRKDEATANKLHSDYMANLFLVGGITLNQWLEAVDLDPVADGNVLIFDMEEDRQEVIRATLGAKQPTKPEEEENGNQQSGNNNNGNRRNGKKIETEIFN